MLGQEPVITKNRDHLTAMAVIILLCFIIVLGSSTSGDAQEVMYGVARERVYRSISPDMKYLLDSMQSQLKFVTQSIDTVRMMCLSRNASDSGMVAFSARLSVQLTSSKASVRVVFDHIVTNIGNAYNGTTGIFTAPSDGVYVFAWTILTDPTKIFDSELVINGSPKLYNAADTGGGSGYESSGCTGVLELKIGNEVWIRKHGTAGNLLKENWSSFSGWKLS